MKGSDTSYWLVKEFVRYCSEHTEPFLGATILLLAGNFMDDVNEKRFHLKDEA